jgi:branched-chain amino acid transport system ATP-binding protein
MSQPLLQVQGVETFYGNIRALGGVDVSVDQGEIVCLIGANGAGKSTLMMTICGSPQARAGKVIFDGQTLPICRPMKSPGCALRNRPKVAASFRA